MTFSQSSFLPPPAAISFNLYHDESGTYVRNGGDRWLMHGVLFVREQRQKELSQALQAVRDELRYYHELHFIKLRKETGAKAECIRKWLKLYLGFSEYCFYHCLAIDTKSPAFRHDEFSEPYYVYNYFARTAIVGGISWFLKGYSKVKLQIFSDPKWRRKNDNFARYIPQAVLASINEKRQNKPGSYPEIILADQSITLVDSDPQKVRPVLKPASEFIQLTDLLTSSVAQALNASSGNQAKIDLAQMMASWIEDTRRPPWLQTKELHRRFSLSCFPNEKGQYYNPNLAVTQRDQLSLF